MQFIRTAEFMQYLFDRPTGAAKAGRIVDGILAGGSARLSDIAEHMSGSPTGNYKTIRRFIAQTDVVAALGRLFQADAEFVIGDATEMPRPKAFRTPYVGKLSDDKTRGYWLLVLATPLSRSRLALSSIELFLAHDCPRRRLAQLASLAGL